MVLAERGANVERGYSVSCLLISVAASLPLVAFATWVLPVEPKATNLAYVAPLLGFGLVLGYLLALARGQRHIRAGLGWIGYRLQPDGTIYAQTLKHMSDEGAVVVELKDGRRIWGAPRAGPQSKEDGITELFVTYPYAEGDGGDWLPVGQGVIVPLAEVSTIALSEDPTGAPPA